MDSRPVIARRTLTRRESDRLVVAYYFARRHLGPNLRRRARMAIRRARGE